MSLHRERSYSQSLSLGACRRPPSTGRCRRPAPNASAVHVDRGAANHGHDRLPLWRQREFPDHWRSHVAALHLSGPDHPSDREAGVAGRVARGRYRLILATAGQSPRNAPPGAVRNSGQARVIQEERAVIERDSRCPPIWRRLIARIDRCGIGYRSPDHLLGRATWKRPAPFSPPAQSIRNVRFEAQESANVFWFWCNLENSLGTLETQRGP